MATVRIQVRRGTASQWTSANPILAAGELGVESDTNLFKFGNGSTTWTALAYANNSDVAIGEISQDAINNALSMGAGLSKTYDDGANTITIAVDAAYFNELAQDAVNTALTAGTGITKTYDDVANTLTVAVDSTIATKTYADNAVTTHQDDTTSVHGITNTADIVYLTGSQTLSGKTLSDVVLTGTPTAPTQSANDNSTKIATTAYVQTELADLIGTAPALLDTLGELSDALNDNENYAAAMTATITGINNSLGLKLPTADFNAHRDDTTDVHGISNTANLVYTSDARLSDNRTPIGGSVTSQSMAVDSIGTTSLIDDAVTAAKIAASAVGTSELADDAVTAAKIAASAVGTSELADLSVTSAKIATDAVGPDHIAASAIGTSELSDDAVTAAKIAASAVGTSELADLSVTSAKIQDLTVTTAKINDASVTEGKIAGLAVTEGKIADGAVSTVKIADSAITTGKLANDSVTTGKIAPDTIVNADINPSAAIAQSKIDGLGAALDLKAPLASPTFTGTVSGVTKSHVGLGNVDNTADTAKPVSTAQATAIATAKSEAIADATSQVNALLTGAPAALNTLDELAAALGDDANFASTVTNNLAAKAPLASPTFTGTVTVGASGVAFTDKTQTKAGVPSLTTIGTAVSSNTTLDALGTDAAVRDSLIPLSGAVNINFEATGNAKYAVGSSISFYQSSSTGANITGTGGITVLSTPGGTLRALNSSVTATKIAATTWLLAGDLR